jgi:hypothetical protein
VADDSLPVVRRPGGYGAAFMALDGGLPVVDAFGDVTQRRLGKLPGWRPAC